MGIEPTGDGMRPPSVLKTVSATRLLTVPIKFYSAGYISVLPCCFKLFHGRSGLDGFISLNHRLNGFEHVGYGSYRELLLDVEEIQAQAAGEDLYVLLF